LNTDTERFTNGTDEQRAETEKAPPKPETIQDRIQNVAWGAALIVGVISGFMSYNGQNGMERVIGEGIIGGVIAGLIVWGGLSVIAYIFVGSSDSQGKSQ
jgi:hypothetical protein